MNANELSENSEEKFQNDRDELFYFENGLMIFTEAYHLKRGECCGNKCRHCPFGYENVEND